MAGMVRRSVAKATGQNARPKRARKTRTLPESVDETSETPARRKRAKTVATMG